MAKILIIEDNPSNLELMSYLLKAFGHDTKAAITGTQGLQMAQGHPFDVIICDIQLPGIDGFEVAKQLKQDPALRGIPLVAITAFAMVGDRDKALDAGFDAYIPKPITPQVFVNQIESHLLPRARGSLDGKNTHC